MNPAVFIGYIVLRWRKDYGWQIFDAVSLPSDTSEKFTTFYNEVTGKGSIFRLHGSFSIKPKRGLFVTQPHKLLVRNN